MYKAKQRGGDPIDKPITPLVRCIQNCDVTGVSTGDIRLPVYVQYCPDNYDKVSVGKDGHTSTECYPKHSAD